MPTVHYTKAAKADLIDIWVAIALENEIAADRVYDRLERIIGMLEQFPEAGRIQSDIDETARVLVKQPYLILYRCLSNGIQIVRVLHGARDVATAMFLEGVE